ncbi:MAG TPA: hypothetical protein VH374_06365 [Polyangia bacterium]|jgi:hypothetical protein|nr:hypothetical protein [Polyangia bacterium]
MESGGDPNRRLCLLGAGRCNDVDLNALLASFSEIHLVDIDAAALNAAVGRVPASARQRLPRHAPVDLSGLSHRLTAWKKKPPTLTEIQTNSTATVAANVAHLPGPFDVVVSACMLTQMSFHLSDVLDQQHPMLGAIRQALLVAHLGTLLELTAPGGEAMLICDLTSSSFYPLDDRPAGGDLRATMDDVLAKNAFYVSANPTLIRRLLRREDGLRGRGGEPTLIDPWLWTGGPQRTYLVYGLRIKRA